MPDKTILPKSMKKNAVLNVIKSSLAIIYSMITYPYALRVLGIENIGKISYGSSILSYFSLVAMLGVATYGVRQGAKYRTDNKRLNEFLKQVYTINIIATICAYIGLFITINVIHNFSAYKTLIAIQSISMIFTTMALDWANAIYEDYYVITIRSIIVYIVSLVLLFVFVHSPNDYYKYALITVFSNVLICITNRLYLRKYIHPGVTLHPNFKTHLKPLLVLFSNNLAQSIYVNFDITMLGWLQGDAVVGSYTAAVKVYSIMKTVMLSIYSVTIPRLSAYIGKNDLSSYKKTYTRIWQYMTIILLPVSVWLIVLSDEIILILGGGEYFQAGTTLKILSVSLLFAIYGGLTTAVLNITTGKEKDNLLATIISATINCLLNLVFIPAFSQNGAAFTTLLSELFVFIFCILRNKDIKKYLNFYEVWPFLLDALIGCGVIVATSFVVKMAISNINVFLQVIIITIISAIMYTIVLLLRKNPIALNYLIKIKRKFH